MLKLTKKYKLTNISLNVMAEIIVQGSFGFFQKLESLCAFSDEREGLKKRLNICYFLQNTSDY